jgi:hypothetical protein
MDEQADSRHRAGREWKMALGLALLLEAAGEARTGQGKRPQARPSAS